MLLFNSKMKILNFFSTALLLITAVLLSSSPVLADSCSSYFYSGSCPVKELVIDKQVINPVSGNFVDNLGPSDPKFSPDSEIRFKLIVKNIGSTDLDNIIIRDVLPSQISFITGPEGSVWDENNRELKFNIGTIKPDQTRELEIKVKALTAQNFPADKSLVCANNWVEAKNDQVSDSDSAGFCIQKVDALPATGPNPLVLTLVLGLAGLGVVLTKKFN